MSSEIRSFIRQIEKWVETDPEKALSEGITAIQKEDRLFNFEGSYIIASKLAEILEQLGDKTRAAKMAGIAAIRATFLNNPIEEKKSLAKLDPERPISLFANSIVDGKGDDSHKHYYLLELEQQSLWGDFKKLTPLPFIDFENADEAKMILEDYFPNAIYHLHMIERNTHQKRRIDIPVGQLEELDVIETVRTVIIKI